MTADERKAFAKDKVLHAKDKFLQNKDKASKLEDRLTRAKKVLEAKKLSGEISEDDYKERIGKIKKAEEKLAKLKETVTNNTQILDSFGK